MEYQLIRSRRRTLAMEIGPKGLVVRAPYGTDLATVERFLAEHRAWIEKHLSRAEVRKEEAQSIPPLTKEERKALIDRAKPVFAARVAYYAARLGVTYGRITVRSQRTKWGSCSAKGDLSFNGLLFLAPPQVLDCIVVHELCHRKEMNHSARFYAAVLSVFPEYHKWHGWLKQHGTALLDRMERGVTSR